MVLDWGWSSWFRVLSVMVRTAAPIASLMVRVSSWAMITSPGATEIGAPDCDCRVKTASELPELAGGVVRLKLHPVLGVLGPLPPALPASIRAMTSLSPFSPVPSPHGMARVMFEIVTVLELTLVATRVSTAFELEASGGLTVRTEGLLLSELVSRVAPA